MLTLIDAEAGERPLDARRDAGRLLVDADALERVTGWVLKPEGLCRDEVCIPVRDRSALVAVDGETTRIDLAAFADALGRLSVVDADEGVAALGAPAAERACRRAPEGARPTSSSRT